MFYLCAYVLLNYKHSSVLYGSLAKVCHLFKAFPFFRGKITALKGSTVMQGYRQINCMSNEMLPPLFCELASMLVDEDLLSVLQIPLSLSTELGIFGFCIYYTCRTNTAASGEPGLVCRINAGVGSSISCGEHLNLSALNTLGGGATG